MGSVNERQSTTLEEANMASPNQGQSDTLVTAEDCQSSSADVSLRLLRQCREGEDGEGRNVVMAPYSLATALAAISMGANGATAQQIKQVLQWSTDIIPEDLDQYISALRRTPTEEIKKKKKTTPFCTLKAALGIFVTDHCPLKLDFSSNAQKIFASGIMPANFQNNPETERENINRWVTEQTLGNVRDILPEDSTDSSTSMVLALGTFYKGVWEHKFDPSKTTQGEFYGPGAPVKAWMMRQTTTFKYGHYLGRQVLELPFVPSPPKEFPCMVVVLSNGDPSDLDFLEESLTPHELMKLLKSLRATKVKVTLPRFVAESSLSLTTVLENQGIPLAFGDTADFSGMVNSGRPAISEVYQKTVIKVDEEGGDTDRINPLAKLFSPGKRRELAAVQSFTADRPFLFFIVNNSGNDPKPIWMAGRVVDPN